MSANQKNVSLLGLSPITADDFQLTPYDPVQKPANREETRIQEAFRKHELIIGLTAEKARLGITAQAIVHKHASDVFAPAVSFMMANKDAVRGTEAYPYVEEFTVRQGRMLGQHLLGTLEIVDQDIALVVHESLNLPPEELTFLQRL